MSKEQKELKKPSKNEPHERELQCRRALLRMIEPAMEFFPWTCRQLHTGNDLSLAFHTSNRLLGMHKKLSTVSLQLAQRKGTDTHSQFPLRITKQSPHLSPHSTLHHHLLFFPPSPPFHVGTVLRQVSEGSPTSPALCISIY